MTATLNHPATRGSTIAGSPSEAGRYIVANATGRITRHTVDTTTVPQTLASPIRTGPPDNIRTLRGLGRI